MATINPDDYDDVVTKAKNRESRKQNNGKMAVHGRSMITTTINMRNAKVSKRVVPK